MTKFQLLGRPGRLALSTHANRFIQPVDAPLDVFDQGELSDLVLVAGTEAFDELRAKMMSAGYPTGTPVQRIDWRTLKASKAVRATFARGRLLPITVLPHTV
jgi:hypothetical protein